MIDLTPVEVGRGSPEGTNRAYVIHDQGLVIDPGPPNAWEALLSGIQESGIDVEEIDHVLVTHWHVDHAGLACRLAERANAEIHMHRDDAEFVGSYAIARDKRVQRDADALAMWGVPEERRNEVIDQDMPLTIPDTYPVTTNTELDRIDDVEVVHTPGHTLGHTCYLLDDALFLGDHLLPDYTPNIGGSDTRLSDPLANYLDSLTRIARYASSVTGYPGHGSPVDISSHIESVRDHHFTRAEATFTSLSRNSPMTPWEVANELFGTLRGIHVKLGAGEAAAHLERLTQLGFVHRSESDTVRYRKNVDEYHSPSSLR